MKKIAILSILFLSFLGFTSCNQDEIQTYNDTDNIYFSQAVFPEYVNQDLTTADSLGFSFGFDNPTITKRIYRIPIRVQGKVNDADRTVKVTVDPLSTAIDGTHFEIQKNIVMRAGKEIDSIAVTVFRTADMKTNTLTLVLNLEENEHFTTKMKTKVVNVLTKKTISFTRFKLSFNDVLSQPKSWLVSSLGVFTAKKLFLMCDLMLLNPNMFNNASGTPGLTIGDMQYYNGFMKRYLADQKASGKTVYEEDGKEMFFP